jgi:MSHA pilin protein MshD
MCTNKPARSRGFSLPELILLIVVMAIALTGILLVFNTAVVGSVNPVVNKQAIAIAESLMDEILLMPFNNPTGGFSGAATQANRAQFDDVGDYNNFATTGIFTIDGTAIAGLAAYSVAVTVVPTALSTVPSTDSKLITVTVTGPGSGVALQGYKLNY